MTAAVDVDELTTRVKAMYRQVAEEPHGGFHFDLGRDLALRLGYPEQLLGEVPPEAVESFAGVGYFFDLAALHPEERVLDLGSGSGTDAFAAASLVGPAGHVSGVDFTVEQLRKAAHIAASGGIHHVEFHEARIEEVPLPDESVDCVVSNGVVNLSPDKAAVFREAARVLRPGGRLALADIVSRRQLTDSIVANPELWASCIGGAAQLDGYLDAVAGAGLLVREVRDNPAYQFLSRSARGATETYGITSISMLAVKPR